MSATFVSVRPPVVAAPGREKAPVRRPSPAGRPVSMRQRRRRVAVLVFTVAALLGAVRAVAAFGAGPASGIERRPAVHIVQPGETLWSVARSLRPSGDVRGLVRQLEKLNGGSSLAVGQRLVLPDGLPAGG